MCHNNNNNNNITSAVLAVRMEEVFVGCFSLGHSKNFLGGKFYLRIAHIKCKMRDRPRWEGGDSFKFNKGNKLGFTCILFRPN